MGTQKRQQGFTLVEVLIVVAIVGILASIAIPSYREYLIRSNRTDAQAYLMELAQRQQQYLMDARAYAGDAETLGASQPDSVGDNYDVVIETGSNPPTFTVTASPSSSIQSGDGDLSIDQAGVRAWAGGDW